jgi:hypothetical protein
LIACGLVQNRRGPLGYQPARPSQVASAVFRVAAANYLKLLGAAATFLVPALLLFFAVVLLAAASSSGSGSDRDALVLVAVLGLPVLVSGYVLAQAAITTGVLTALCGQPVSLGRCVRAPWSRLASLFWIFVLVASFLVLCSLFIGIMGVVFLPLALIGLVPVLYVSIGWIVVVPVVIVEGRRGSKALGRSRYLVSGRWWPTFGTTLLVGLPIGILSSILESALKSLSPGSHLFQSATQLVVELLVAPAVAGIPAAIYLDLRLRSDRVTLDQTASDLGIAPPPGPAGSFGYGTGPAATWQPGGIYGQGPWAPPSGPGGQGPWRAPPAPGQPPWGGPPPPAGQPPWGAPQAPGQGPWGAPPPAPGQPPWAAPPPAAQPPWGAPASPGSDPQPPAGRWPDVSPKPAPPERRTVQWGAEAPVPPAVPGPGSPPSTQGPAGPLPGPSDAPG